MDFSLNPDRLMHDAIQYELSAISELIEHIYKFRYAEESLEKACKDIRRSPLFHREIDSIYTYLTQALQRTDQKPAFIIDDCIIICILCKIKTPHYLSDSDFHLCWRLIVLANRCVGIATQALKYELEEKTHRDDVISSNEDNIQKLRRTDPLLHDIVELLRWKCPDTGWKRLSIALKEHESEVLAILEKHKPSTNEKIGVSGSLIMNDPLKYLSERIKSRRKIDAEFKAITNALLDITNRRKQLPAREASLDIARLLSTWNAKPANQKRPPDADAL